MQVQKEKKRPFGAECAYLNKNDRHCEERSDAAISNRLMPRHEIAALRSQ